jgi:hypothetical protein
MPSVRSDRRLFGWMQRDYFRRRDLFRGWWRWPVLFAGIASLLVLGVMLLARGKRTFHAGPLSTPHAAFDRDCGLCHQTSFGTLGRLNPWSGATSVPDSACQRCHAGSRHNDHSAVKGACVDCHKEHRGHDALVRVDDRRCTGCHENLHRDDGSAPGPAYGGEAIARKVTRFDGTEAHPDFRRRRGNEGAYPDPGQVRFNHAVHLDPDGIDEIDQGQLKKQLGDGADPAGDPFRIPLPVRRRVLGCADCHRMDGEGRYAEPIAYERHCKSCHPLLARLGGDWRQPRLRELAWKFSRTPARHPSPGGSPLVVRAELRQRLADFIRSADGRAFLEAPAAPPSPLPGRDPAGSSLSEQEYAWVNRQLGRTERALLRGPGCAYCHEHVVEPDGEGLPAMRGARIPSRWWDHAKFKHVSHRMLTCTECHPAKESTKNSDVLLPGKATCVRCHDGRASVTARADCVACHAYHDPTAQRQARQTGRLRIGELSGR